MKKILFLLTLLSSSALADEGFYLHKNISVNKLNEIDFNTPNLQGKLKQVNNFPAIEVGIGYDIDDKLSTEISYANYFTIHAKEKCLGATCSRYQNYYFDLKHTTEAHSLFLNKYYKLGSYKEINSFVGAGIGVTRLKEKVEGTATDELATRQDYILDSVNKKQIYNFSYKFTIGLSYNLNNNATIQLMYNYLTSSPS